MIQTIFLPPFPILIPLQTCSQAARALWRRRRRTPVLLLRLPSREYIDTSLVKLLLTLCLKMFFQDPSRQCDRFDPTDPSQIQTCGTNEACLLYQWKKSSTETGKIYRKKYSMEDFILGYPYFRNKSSLSCENIRSKFLMRFALVC